MPKTPARGGSSDADLGAKILAGWERMTRAVPDGPRHNRRLADHFGVGVSEIQHVRDIRNGVAHPDEPISRQDLEQALAIIRRAKRRTGTPARALAPASPAVPTGKPRRRESARAGSASTAQTASTRSGSTRAKSARSASAAQTTSRRAPATSSGSTRAKSTRSGSARSATAATPSKPGATRSKSTRPKSARSKSARSGATRSTRPKPAKSAKSAAAAKSASTRNSRRRGKITFVEETTALGRAWQRLRRIWSWVEDYWIALAVVLLGVPAAIVGAVHLGPVGLLVGPLVAAGGVGVLVAAALMLVVVAWVAAVVLAGAAVVFAAVLLIQGEYLEGLAILGVLAIVGAAYLIWDSR